MLEEPPTPGLEVPDSLVVAARRLISDEAEAGGCWKSPPPRGWRSLTAWWWPHEGRGQQHAALVEKQRAGAAPRRR